MKIVVKLAAVFLALACASVAHAIPVTYEFVLSGAQIRGVPDVGSINVGEAGDVLVELTFAHESTQYDFTDLVSFVFTMDGNDLFGFGEGEYLGSFEIGAYQFDPPRFVVPVGIDLESSSGSSTQADWADFDPPPSSIPNAFEFHVQFGETDQLILSGPESLVANGSFRRKNGTVGVPEPTTLALLGLGLVGMAARRRKLRGPP